MNRHGRRRKLRKYLPEGLITGAYVALALPLLLIAAPFVLTGYAISERLRLCPLCGQRGTLRPLGPVHSAGLDSDLQDWPRYRRYKVRVDPEQTVLRCSACGLHIRRADLETKRASPVAV